MQLPATCGQRYDIPTKDLSCDANGLPSWFAPRQQRFSFAELAWALWLLAAAAASLRLGLEFQHAE